MKAHCPRSEATFERQRRTDRNISNVSRPKDFIFSPKYTDVGKFYTKTRQNLPQNTPFPQFYKTTPQCSANEYVRTRTRTCGRDSYTCYGFKFNCRSFADNSALTASNVPSALTEINGILPSSFLTAA